MRAPCLSAPTAAEAARHAARDADLRADENERPDAADLHFALVHHTNLDQLANDLSNQSGCSSLMKSPEKTGTPGRNRRRRPRTARPSSESDAECTELDSAPADVTGRFIKTSGQIQQLTSASLAGSSTPSRPTTPGWTGAAEGASPPRATWFVRRATVEDRHRRRFHPLHVRPAVPSAQQRRRRVVMGVVRMCAAMTLLASVVFAAFAAFAPQPEARPRPHPLRPNTRRTREPTPATTNGRQPRSTPPPPNNKDDLVNLYKQLDDVAHCNRTLDTPLLRQLLNSTIKKLQVEKPVLQWLSNVAPRYPYLLEMKNTPMNTTVTKTPLIRPGSVGPVHVLHLDCGPKPHWVPVSVYATATSETFVEMRLPELELDACSFSQCYQSKCSWTLHGDLKVYAKPCCDQETRFCRADWTAMQSSFYVLSVLFALGSLAMIPVVIRERHRQQQEARGWALMELFFVGAAVLYTIPLIDWVGPATYGCVVAVWLREVGFTLFYGSIVLKIYRNLQEYRVRKAHHVIVREQDLLKYLAGFMVITLTGLVAWTLGVQHSNSLWTAQWPQCPFESWALMWTLFEMSFLFYGIRLCYKARSSNWVERYQFTAAVCLEVLVHLSVQAVRYALRDVGSSDVLFVTAIIQLHLTVSVNIAAIMTPKFIVNSETSRRTLSMSGTGNSSRAHPSLAKLRDNLINGTIDFAEVPIIDMNPEDIRAELKRVYTQLRMYKLKNLYQDNPHISKRKGGKKVSDKTTKNRRISIPPTSSPKVRRVDEEDEKSDLTVESAPHNIYLSTNKIQLESSDLSVRV